METQKELQDKLRTIQSTYEQQIDVAMEMAANVLTEDEYEALQDWMVGERICVFPI